MNLYELGSSLRQAIEDMEDGGVPNEIIIDTVSHERDEICRRACTIMRIINELRVEAAARKQAAAKMADRAKASENKAERLRQYLELAMAAAGIAAVGDDEVIGSFRKQPAKLEVAEALLPSEYLISTTSTRVDKEGLRKDLSSGKLITGAKLVEAPKKFYVRQ